jgi:hypothetical protein
MDSEKKSRERNAVIRGWLLVAGLVLTLLGLAAID